MPLSILESKDLKIGYNGSLDSEFSNADTRSELTGAECNQQDENRYE
jgi:hypothetical protein